MPAESNDEEDKGDGDEDTGCNNQDERSQRHKDHDKPPGHCTFASLFVHLDVTVRVALPDDVTLGVVL
jgi:hypothetical protein